MQIIKKIVSLKNHVGFMRYFKNSAWMISEQMLRMIAGVFVGVWVARYLGPEQFGIFSYVAAFTALFASIAKLGLDSIVVRELVNQPDKQDVYLGTAFWMKVLGAITVISLIALVLPWTSNDSTTSLYIFIIASGLFFQSFEIVDFYFQSQVLAKYISICKVIQLLFSSCIKIYLVLTGAELIWFVGIILFDQIMLAITYYIAYRCHKFKFLPLMQVDLSIAKSLIKDAWPLILSGIVVMIYMRIDQIMIKDILGEYEVGIYSAAVRLSEMWYFIPMLISSSLFPAIINAKKVSIKLYHQRLQNFYTFLVWIAIIVSILTTLFSDWLVIFLYGDAYQEASHVLIINIWASIFVFLGVASGKWFISENLQWLAFLRALYGMILNIVLNYILISKYGIVGAAISTLIAQIMAAYIFDIFNAKTRISFKLKSKAFLPVNLIR